MTRTDDLLSLSLYLTEIYHTFRCEIPHINHPKLVSNKVRLLTTAANKKMNTIKSNPSQKTFSTNVNELLLKRSMLKPVSHKKSKKFLKTETPFDYWINKNEILANDCSNKPASSFWNDTEDSQLKFYDEHFREITPERDAAVLQTSITKTDVIWKNSNINTVKSSKNNCISSSDSSECDSSEDVASCDIKIRLIKQDSYNKQLTQTFSFNFKQNILYVSPKKCSQIKEHCVPRCLRDRNYQEGLSLLSRTICHTSKNLPILNFYEYKLLFNKNMSDHCFVSTPEEMYERVVNWLNRNNVENPEDDNEKSVVDQNKLETNISGNLSDISSISKVLKQQRKQCNEKITEVPKTVSEKTVLTQDSSDARLQAVVQKLKNSAMVNNLKKITNLNSLQMYRRRVKTNSKTPPIPSILESEELVCFPLYTFITFLSFYLLFTKYREYLICFLFCPY